jgi:hypothetical protein
LRAPARLKRGGGGKPPLALRWGEGKEIKFCILILLVENSNMWEYNKYYVVAAYIES